MEITPVLNSIKAIEKQYNTGELPVLVTCSDRNTYICKYMRSSGSAFKLGSELIGAFLAEAWGIPSPPFAFVRIEPSHWAGIFTPHSLSAPAFGYKKLDCVVDITPSTYQIVYPSIASLEQLLWIALFDFWIANESNVGNITSAMPIEWNIPKTIVTDKLRQLFDRKWINEVWQNFNECIKDSYNYE